jgi:hypothetical protein
MNQKCLSWVLVSVVLSAVWCPPPVEAQQLESNQPDFAPPADGDLGSTMTLESLGKRARRVEEERQAPVVVRPAAEPLPALKYRGWPADRDLRPGSAQLHYYRAVAHYMRIPREDRARIDKQWFSDEPHPGDEQRQQLVQQLAAIYDELHQLARSEDFQWDHRWRDMRGSEIYSYLLHDVQEARTLARLLTLKIQDQLHRKDFEGAVSSLSDGFRLAAFVCNGETLVQQLVGIAIAGIMQQEVERAIQLPDCPNLYWALAAVPQPISDIRRSLAIELGNIARMFPVLEQAETEDRDEEYWTRQWAGMVQAVEQLGGSQGSEFRFALALAPVAFAGPARERLAASGMDRQHLEQMPTVRVVLMDAARELRVIREELEKSILLPYAVARPLIEREEAEFKAWTREVRHTSAAGPLASLVMPAVLVPRMAEVRSVYQQRRLMLVEALRMHAAAHDGQLPDSLAALDPVPALPDPFTGGPFTYHVQREATGTTVVIDGAEIPEQFKSFSQMTLRFPKP